MKIRCERDVLLKALSTAGRAVSQRSHLPALAGLRLEAADNQLRVLGTDLDLTIESRVPVSVAEIGACVIPARLGTEIVKSMTPGDVTIEYENAEAKLSAGKTQFSLRTLDPAEWPTLVSPPDLTATLSSTELGEALAQVLRAASTDDDRPILTGVLLSAEPAGLRFVATDSYRLAVRDAVGIAMLQAGQSVLVPGRALGELSRLLPTAEKVQVALGKREITCAIGDTQITSRLIEGKFPDYRPLIPKDYPNRCRVDRDVLIDAVRRMKLLARDTTTPVRLGFLPDHVGLSALSAEVGTATEDVDAKYEGDPLTMGFTAEYLIDGLEALAPGDVLIETSDALKPAVLKTADRDEFLYLLMPHRLT